MSVSIIATGIYELDLKFADLPEKTQKKFARSALSQGMTIVRRAAMRAAPVGRTGNLRRSIRSRFKRIKRLGITEAKVGIDVGKRTKKLSENTAGAAPHGHLVALGTRPRFTGSKSYSVKTGRATALTKLKSFADEAGRRTVATGKPRAFRGSMPANPFFSKATQSVEDQAEKKMIEVLTKKIAEDFNR